MFVNPLVLVGTNFELVTQRQLSSVRSVAARALEPKTVNIAHEVANSGRVNTAVILDDSKLVAPSGTCPTSKLSSIKTTFRMSYNPSEGRIDVRAALLQQRDELIALLTDANIDKLLNKES